MRDCRVLLAALLLAAAASASAVLATARGNVWLVPEVAQTRLGLVFGEDNATVLAAALGELEHDAEYEITISYSSATPAVLQATFLSALHARGAVETNQIRFSPAEHRTDFVLERDGVPTACVAVRVVASMGGVLHPGLRSHGAVPQFVPVDVVLSKVRFGVPQRALPVLQAAAAIGAAAFVVVWALVARAFSSSKGSSSKSSGKNKQE